MSKYLETNLANLLPREPSEKLVLAILTIPLTIYSIDKLHKIIDKALDKGYCVYAKLHDNEFSLTTPASIS